MNMDVEETINWNRFVVAFNALGGSRNTRHDTDSGESFAAIASSLFLVYKKAYSRRLTSSTRPKHKNAGRKQTSSRHQITPQNQGVALEIRARGAKKPRPTWLILRHTLTCLAF
ncbi:MAG: hypothetical protein IJU44_11775 [Kiritimatiellae bacterium]|nr:hypothetical protein [Kiritimatiellia bacterium]